MGLINKRNKSSKKLYKKIILVLSINIFWGLGISAIGKTKTPTSSKLNLPSNPSEAELVATIPFREVSIGENGSSKVDKTALENWRFDAIPLLESTYEDQPGKVKILKLGPSHIRIDSENNFYFFYAGSIFEFNIHEKKIKSVGNLLKREGKAVLDVEILSNGEVGFLIQDRQSFNDGSVRYIRKSLNGKTMADKRVKSGSGSEFSSWSIRNGGIYHWENKRIIKKDFAGTELETPVANIGSTLVFSEDKNYEMRKLIQREIPHLFIAPLHSLGDVNGANYYQANGVFGGKDEINVVFVKKKNGDHKTFVLPHRGKFLHDFTPNVVIDARGSFYYAIDDSDSLKIYKYAVN